VPGPPDPIVRPRNAREAVDLAFATVGQGSRAPPPIPMTDAEAAEFALLSDVDGRGIGARPPDSPWRAGDAYGGGDDTRLGLVFDSDGDDDERSRPKEPEAYGRGQRRKGGKPAAAAAGPGKELASSQHDAQRAIAGATARFVGMEVERDKLFGRTALSSGEWGDLVDRAKHGGGAVQGELDRAANLAGLPSRQQCDSPSRPRGGRGRGGGFADDDMEAAMGMGLSMSFDHMSIDRTAGHSTDWLASGGGGGPLSARAAAAMASGGGSASYDAQAWGTSGQKLRESVLTMQSAAEDDWSRVAAGVEGVDSADPNDNSLKMLSPSAAHSLRQFAASGGAGGGAPGGMPPPPPQGHGAAAAMPPPPGYRPSPRMTASAEMRGGFFGEPPPASPLYGGGGSAPGASETLDADDIALLANLSASGPPSAAAAAARQAAAASMSMSMSFGSGAAAVATSSSGRPPAAPGRSGGARANPLALSHDLGDMSLGSLAGASYGISPLGAMGSLGGSGEWGRRSGLTPTASSLSRISADFKNGGISAAEHKEAKRRVIADSLADGA